jgi:hypothetical protein
MYAAAMSCNALVTFNGKDVTAVHFIKRPDDAPTSAK